MAWNKPQNPKNDYMKILPLRTALCVIATAVSCVCTTQAQFTITITVDENGNGTLVNSRGFFSPLGAALSPDPGPGGLPVALTYGLLNPPGLTAGDLVLIEPGGSGVPSDIIRFNPQQNGGSLVFYSDSLDGTDALADLTGFPTALYANNLTENEAGPEVGPNGFSYTPTAGQPGFDTGAGGPVTYVIQSDTSPVPDSGSSLMLLSIGLVGLMTGGRRLFSAA